MKKKVFVCVGLFISLGISGCSGTPKTDSTYSQDETQATETSRTEQSTTTTKSTATSTEETSSATVTTSTSAAETVDLSGIFYTAAGDTATVKLVSENNWSIAYSTLDGDVTATFETKWVTSGQAQQSKTPMKKSDAYSGFDIIVEYVSPTDTKITMDDGNAAHKMVFTRQKPAEDKKYDAVLQGDLSLFDGKFSTDAFNQSIADSGFTLGGYSPEDYFNDRTTVFPGITDNMYWNGLSSHGIYEVSKDDLPKKVNGYYEVHVHGVNGGANNGELTFFLVPPKITGPDGTLSDDKRVFQVLGDGTPQLLEYQKDQWWKDYQ
ncbi:hypothetical protein BAU15_01560 [Enterococcus sp. JM4C]|uniref:hypothetical protein n=1 Tax=Candidatus Enterococcus huntleyi TaxID=1857217 RepID=UPI001379A8E6|nr:hypothetical protein [Enterococcus sp. JM4C]KAF1299360.1 hypothetical protein BAU15_01560 [Enterococcus sp. JM4C]